MWRWAIYGRIATNDILDENASVRFSVWIHPCSFMWQMTKQDIKAPGPLVYHIAINYNYLFMFNLFGRLIIMFPCTAYDSL